LGFLTEQLYAVSGNPGRKLLSGRAAAPNLTRSFLVMARPRKPWYRKPRDTWFVEIDGKQVPVAKGEHNRAAAEKELHRLKSLRDEPDPSISPDSVVSLLGRFLGWTKKHKSPATYEQRRYFLKSFVRHRGVKKLRPERVTVEVAESWLDAHPRWKASRRHTILCLLRAFNWSVNRGKRARNPIAAIEVPV
jgi:hypothetical protein